MAKGEIVETSFPDRFTGPGGRNRIRGGAGDTGGNHDMGAGGSHGKANGDALAGSYGPDKITATSGLDLQHANNDTTGESGKTLDTGLVTQRSLAAGNVGNAKKSGSEAQGPDGSFGNKPGDQSKTSPYISGN